MGKVQITKYQKVRRSKIVATIGPASERETTIEQMIVSGANFFRFNLKYSPPEWHNDKIRKIRKIAKRLNKTVGIIVDRPRADFGSDITDWDYLALSYLKSAGEVSGLRQQLSRKGQKTQIIAKIENRAAINDLQKIVDISDGIMVARGDLGAETPIEELAYFQKQIIDSCRLCNKPVIVATEMLYSMVKNVSPTRAEATDVANAVFDGTDALMLSEESAIGEHPVEAVKVMSKIVSFCENTGELRKVTFPSPNLTESLIKAAAEMCNSEKIKAAVVFTKSGNTGRLLSRYRLKVPIIAVCDDEDTIRNLNLSYGVIPYFRKFLEDEYNLSNPVFDEIKSLGIVGVGDMVIVVHGNNWLTKGSTNQLSLREL